MVLGTGVLAARRPGPSCMEQRNGKRKRARSTRQTDRPTDRTANRRDGRTSAGFAAHALPCQPWCWRGRRAARERERIEAGFVCFWSVRPGIIGPTAVHCVATSMALF